jgi:hypothetical protein
MNSIFKKSVLACLSTLLLNIAQASPIAVVSYDMPNGSGQASGGNYNYWDKNYSGAGSTTTDGAPLTGGKGDLTDGFVSTLNWFSAEAPSGIGPYVGWRNVITPTPTIKFNFGSQVNLDSITIHMDDANGAGGVAPPRSVGISTDNLNYDVRAITDQFLGDPFFLTLSGLGLVTDSVWLKFDYRDTWIFIDEVSFDGGARKVPEPGVLSLLGLSLLAMAGVRRRRC